ncbi:MAG: hypothetical protein RJA34_1642 [Pseudomonadota bacterium]|jgi:hypothetical protein
MEPLPNWVTPVLQGTAYWLGMQEIMGERRSLSEGAITLTLRDLMRRHLEKNLSIDTEVMYRNIPEYQNDNLIKDSRTRSDIIIYQPSKKYKEDVFSFGQVKSVIEVKHHRSSSRLIQEDIDFLGARRSHEKSIRTFMIYTSMCMRPDLFTNESGAAISGTQFSDNKTKYSVRRVCRAVQKIPRNNSQAHGHYAVLIEIGA